MARRGCKRRTSRRSKPYRHRSPSGGRCRTDLARRPARAGVQRVPTHTTDASRHSRCIGRVLPSSIARPYDVRSNALATRSPCRQRPMLQPE
ncbi:hypothetical protein DID97_00460 [Burkholderia sp. Bp8977]|nr:hypothetical protein DIE10_00485 [Burkholderia sp. Bp9011]RQR99144.1 hypothetical protein DIE09_00675 [Burkholderia sp. Bp9010]RQS02194.1 hypothetical protein DIE02_24305 [Burkholderia sp. Bp8991]RQS82154.1 hypothetical protein DID97_00460 [Burkholderia sp. Bp8977]